MDPRTKLKYVIDLGMVISFLAVFITGILKFKQLMSALGVNQSALPIRDLSIIHDWSGLLLGVLIMLHLILNFKWLTCMTKNLLKGKPEKKCDI